MLSPFDDELLLPCEKGSFNNYVDKKRGEGVSKKSTLGHVTKEIVSSKKSPIGHAREGGGKNW